MNRSQTKSKGNEKNKGMIGNGIVSSGMLLSFVVLFAIAVVAVVFTQSDNPALAEIDTLALEQAKIIPEQEILPEIEQPVAFEEPKEVIIEIYHREYVPKEVTITPGTTVTWINVDWIRGEQVRAWPHIVKIDKVNERSLKLREEDTFSYTFTEPGEYRFIDSIYPHILQGVVIVEEDEPEIPALTGGVIMRPESTPSMLGMLVVIVALSIIVGLFLGFKDKRGRIQSVSYASVAMKMLSLLLAIFTLTIPVL